jgi:cytochrome b561
MAEPIDSSRTAPASCKAPRYSRKSRLLHWSMAALVALAYLLIEGRGWFPKGSALRTCFIQGHFWVGLVVLALVLPRVLARLGTPAAAVAPPPTPALLLSRVTHYALYGFLLAQPLMGVLVVLLERGGLPLGSLTLASPFAQNSNLAHGIEEIHVLVGTVFYYVIGLHILAALWHHFHLRDDVLRRML